MAEHVHVESSKRVERGTLSVRTVVRRKYAEGELAIYREMGYDNEVRYCGDPQCLGPEPPPRGMA